MKATISANGMLIVVADTPAEAYALRQWGIENLHGRWDCVTVCDGLQKLLIAYGPDFLSGADTIEALAARL